MTQKNDSSYLDIAGMNYNQLIALVKETNRPPGGVNSLAIIAREAFLGPSKKVLEIGTSTGFSAIELATLTHSHITAIDIDKDSLIEARLRADRASVGHYCQFVQADATNMDLPDSSYDLVLCGNVTSIIARPELAFREYARVLRPGGMLAAIPIYYCNPPSVDMVNRVSSAVGTTIEPREKQYYIDFFGRHPYDIYFAKDYVFDSISSSAVDSHVNRIMNGRHLASLSRSAFSQLRAKYNSYMHLFRDNLSLMGFTILILRKKYDDIDPELFTSRVAPHTV